MGEIFLDFLKNIQIYFFILLLFIFLYFFSLSLKTEKLFHINLHWPRGKSTPKYEIFGQRNHPLTQSLTHFKAKLTNITDIYFFYLATQRQKVSFPFKESASD